MNDINFLKVNHIYNLLESDITPMEDMKVEIQPYEWIGKDIDGVYTIRIYGHTKDIEDNLSEQALIIIDDYKPCCKIELPSKVNGKNIKWNIDALEVYTQWLRRSLEADNHLPTQILYRNMEKLYNFKKHRKYPFLLCYFNTEEAMNHCIKLINKKGYKINKLGYIHSRVWERNISTIHRLITDANIGYGQWLNIDATIVKDLNKISYCKYEYTASWKSLTSINENDSNGFTVSPKVVAIDIECYSHNHRAMPSKDLVDDVVYQISFIIQRLNHPNTRRKLLLTTTVCDDIKDAEVIHYEDEIDMINGMCNMIVDYNPSIITGYNIFGFDLPYLNGRLKLYFKKWKKCGMIIDEPSGLNISKWHSSAYGFVTVAPLQAEGRICIDMFQIIRRDYKLDRYTLDFVSHHFLNHGKHDVTAQDMFKIYEIYDNAKNNGDSMKLKEISVDMAKVGEYCLEDSCLCIDLMQKLNTWIMLTELATIVCVTPFQIFTKGQQIRVQNQIYKYTHKENYVIDERSSNNATSFKGGSVQDPIPGKYGYILIFDFASLYPCIIIAFNICYTTLVPPESDITDDMCHILSWEEEDNNGNPIKYRYRFIKQKYYHGILPRMCENLIKSRKETRRKISPLNDSITNEVLNQRQLGLKVSANSIFGALGVSEGRLPMPEGSRSITATGRALIKKSSEYVEKVYGGKIVYGDTDSIMVNLNLKDPNQCLYWGEKLEKELTDLFPDPLVMEFEATYAIGLFVSKKRYAAVPLKVINLKSGDKITKVEFNNEYRLENTNLYKVESIRDGICNIDFLMIPNDSKFISNSLPTNKKLSITISEQGYLICGNYNILPTIGGIPVSEGGKPNPNKLNTKGIILARRDNCLWLREAYMRVLLSIMFDKPLNHTLEIINEEIENMMTRQVPFNKMLVTKNIGSNYKPNSNYPLKLFMDELHRQGHKVEVGERLDYIFVKDALGRDKQGYKMRLVNMYLENTENEPLDYLHYIEKILQNPVEQILYLGYKKHIDYITEKYQPINKKRNKIYTYLSKDYIKTQVKLIRNKEKMMNEIIQIKKIVDSYQKPRVIFNIIS